MSILLGTRRGLDACASDRGTFTVLALDHRQNLRRELHPDAPDVTTVDEMVDFKRTVVRELSPHATGTLLDPEIGAAQCIADGSLPPGAGLIVAIEATGYEGSPGARVSRVLPGGVERGQRLGVCVGNRRQNGDPAGGRPKHLHRERRAVDLGLDVPSQGLHHAPTGCPASPDARVEPMTRPA